MFLRGRYCLTQHKYLFDRFVNIVTDQELFLSSTFQKNKISHVLVPRKSLQSLGAECLAVAFLHAAMAFPFQGRTVLLNCKENAPLSFPFSPENSSPANDFPFQQQQIYLFWCWSNYCFSSPSRYLLSAQFDLAPIVPLGQVTTDLFHSLKEIN